MKTFKTFTKYTVKCKHVQATVEVNRNFLGSLLTFSISKEREREKERVIYLPAALATVGGKRRKTSKEN